MKNTLNLPIDRLTTGLAAIAMLAVTTILRAEVTPEAVQNALVRLDAYAERAMETGIPGMAIGVVYRDQVLFLKGYGVRKVGEPELVDPDTVFQIASVSKPITSTIVARAVTEGVVDWDDRITRYLPDFRLSNPSTSRMITIRDMLCHRSGLPDHAGDLIEDLGFDQAYVLERLPAYDTGNRFRAAYDYTNFGITAGAEAVAAAYAKPWQVVARENLFDRLGMVSTSMVYVDYLNAPNRAVLHSQVDPVAGGPFVPAFQRNPDAQAPAAGVSSTVRDLSQWMRLQLANGRFDGQIWIKPEILAETHKPHMVSEFDTTTLVAGFYGLGWNVSSPDRGGRVFLRHSGEFLQGTRTQVSLLPSQQLGIVTLVNAAPNGIPEAMSQAFFDYVLRGKLSRNWIVFANKRFYEMTMEGFEGDGVGYTVPPEHPTEPRHLSQYVGRYGNDVFGPAKIHKKGKRMFLSMGPEPMIWEVFHYDGDLFYYDTTGENRSGLRGVQFSFEDGGERANRVTIKTYNNFGLGVFDRL